jgi:hypothetical protein
MHVDSEVTRMQQQQFKILCFNIHPETQWWKAYLGVLMHTNSSEREDLMNASNLVYHFSYGILKTRTKLVSPKPEGKRLFGRLWMRD